MIVYITEGNTDITNSISDTQNFALIAINDNDQSRRQRKLLALSVSFSFDLDRSKMDRRQEKTILNQSNILGPYYYYKEC